MDIDIEQILNMFYENSDHCFEDDENYLYDNEDINGEATSNAKSINSIQNSDDTKKIGKRKKKTHIDLTIEAQELNRTLQRLFTTKKKIRKELLIKYIMKACDKNKELRKIKRCEKRSFGLFYNNHADQKELIIQTLKELINDGEINL